MQLLLVEDDEMIAEPVLAALGRLGFTVDWARDDRETKLILGRGAQDLVILDLNVRMQDGLDLLATIRSCSTDVPLLLLTVGEAVDDRIHGLDPGTIGFETTHFDLGELTARVCALLRTRPGHIRSIYSHGELNLNATSREATKSGVTLDLLPREFSLLQALMEDPARVFPCSELEKKIYRPGETIGSHAVDAHVRNLRGLIGAEEIVTVRGVGYRLNRIA
ncbi:response regulator transcription factor [Caballeronia calidae]|uniref:response regulator transcription factor n=1 Tax=Caballeronia calidae TaxID=1777139 RepID=UPI000789741E|nr:response regulator transcription factor [Caballeronia calidae]